MKPEKSDPILTLHNLQTGGQAKPEPEPQEIVHSISNMSRIKRKYPKPPDPQEPLTLHNMRRNK